MKRASVLLLGAVLAVGTPAARAGNFMSGARNNVTPEGARVGARYVPEAEGFVGPYGQPIPIVAPPHEPTGSDYARAALARSFPSELLTQAGVRQTAYQCGPGGCPPMMPGMPGVGGPPGMNAMVGPPGSQAAMNSAAYNGPPGAVAGVGAMVPGAGGGGMGAPFGVSRTEIRFVGPAGMKISWYVARPDGSAGLTPQYLEAPARYNFLQASIYRIKLSDIPGRPGVELYPTLEVVPANGKTTTFLAHAAVPVNFTEEDFEQVAAGNFIVKVIYLPDPQFQDLAATGPDEVVSSRLEPGVDPLIEAKRRGSILAVVRLGNIDLEAPNTPAMDAPPAGAGKAGNNAPPPGLGRMMPGPMMPPGMMPPGMMPPGYMPPMPGASKATVPVKTQTPNNAPMLPIPGTPGTKAPVTPLGKMPSTAPVQPVSVQPKPAPKRSLLELLGRPTTEK